MTLIYYVLSLLLRICSYLLRCLCSVAPVWVIMCSWYIALRTITISHELRCRKVGNKLEMRSGEE